MFEFAIPTSTVDVVQWVVIVLNTVGIGVLFYVNARRDDVD